jgi:hypothetical protein
MPPVVLRSSTRIPVLACALALAGCGDASGPATARPEPPAALGWRLHASLSPGRWAVDREPNTAVIHIGMDPDENVTVYNPAPIRLENGDILVYVKQDGRGVITAFRSTDEGRTFSFEGTAIPHGPAGAWDEGKILDPVVVHDAATGMIHLWYKAVDLEGERVNWRGRLRVGYAIAHAGSPTVFLRRPEPVLEPAAVEAALGLAPGSVEDLGLSDVLLIDGTWYFYGFYSLARDDYRIFYGTGADPAAITPRATVLQAGAGYDLAYEATVFRHPASPVYLMIFSEGAIVDGSEIVHQRAAWSMDGAAWERFPEWVLLPDDEVRLFAGAMLKENRAPFAAMDLSGPDVLYFYSFSPWPWDNWVGFEATGVARFTPWSSRFDSRVAPRLLVTRPRDARTPKLVVAPAAWTDVGWTAKPVAVPNDMVHWGVRPWYESAEIMVREPGTYAFRASVEFEGEEAGARALRLVVNDTSVVAEQWVSAAGHVAPTVVELSGAVRLEPRDRLRLQARQSSGLDLRLFGGTLYPSLFLGWTEP